VPLLDYEDEDEEEPEAHRSSRGRKKPCYRCPDDLGALGVGGEEAGEHLVEEERLAGAAAEAEVKPKRRGAKRNRRKEMPPTLLAMICFRIVALWRHNDPTPLVRVGLADGVLLRRAAPKPRTHPARRSR